MEEYVYCLECDPPKKFKQITSTHLKNKHDITIREYLELHPDSNLLPQSVRDKLVAANKAKWSDPHYKIRTSKAISDILSKQWGEGRYTKIKPKKNLITNIEGHNGYIVDNYCVIYDMVQCQICNRYFKLISSTHLEKHDVTFEEYKNLYPDAKLMSDSVRDKHVKSAIGRELTTEQKFRCGNGARGRVQTEEEKENRRQSNIIACTDDVKKRISDSVKATLADGGVVAGTNKTKARRRFLIRFFNEMRILEQAAYGNLIQCEICGEYRENVSSSHLVSHGVTLEEYKEMFPSAKIYAQSYPKRISAGYQGITYDEWESFAIGQEYCPKFDEICRESNRDKYDRRCFICDLHERDNITSTGWHKRLAVHHVDMNKNQGCDGIRWKLVPLCMKCHKPSHTKIWESRIEYLLNNVWS